MIKLLNSKIGYKDNSDLAHWMVDKEIVTNKITNFTLLDFSLVKDRTIITTEQCTDGELRHFIYKVATFQRDFDIDMFDLLFEASTVIPT